MLIKLFTSNNSVSAGSHHQIQFSDSLKERLDLVLVWIKIPLLQIHQNMELPNLREPMKRVTLLETCLIQRLACIKSKMYSSWFFKKCLFLLTRKYSFSVKEKLKKKFLHLRLIVLEKHLILKLWKISSS